MSQTVLEMDAPSQAATGIVDCDIHPSFRSPNDLAPFLSARGATIGASMARIFARGCPRPSPTRA